MTTFANSSLPLLRVSRIVQALSEKLVTAENEPELQAGDRMAEKGCRPTHQSNIHPIR